MKITTYRSIVLLLILGACSVPPHPSIKHGEEFILMVFLGPKNDRSINPLVLTRGEKIEFHKRLFSEPLIRLFWDAPLPPPQMENCAELYEVAIPGREFESIIQYTKNFLGSFSDLIMGKEAEGFYSGEYGVSQHILSKPAFQLVLSTNEGIRQQMVKFPQMCFYLQGVLKLLSDKTNGNEFYIERLKDKCRYAFEEFSDPDYFALEKLSVSGEDGLCLCFFEYSKNFENTFKNQWDDYDKLDPWTLFWRRNHRENRKSTVVYVSNSLAEIIRSIQKEKAGTRLFIERDMLREITRKDLPDVSGRLILMVRTPLGVEYYVLEEDELAKKINSLNRQKRDKAFDNLMVWIKKG